MKIRIRKREDGNLQVHIKKTLPNEGRGSVHSNVAPLELRAVLAKAVREMRPTNQLTYVGTPLETP